MERALIGSLLTYAKWDEIKISSLWVKKEDFRDLDMRDVFEAMRLVEEDGNEIDLVTVREKMKALGSVMENSELIALTNIDHSSANIWSYVNYVRAESKRFEVMRISEEMRLRAQSGDFSADSMFEAANKILSLIGTWGAKYGVDGETYEDWCEYLKEREGKDLFGFSWGSNLKFLDTYTKGIQKGRTYRIGAPSNTGKSQLAYGVINSLVAQGAKVAFFTLENDKPFTLTNMYANSAGVSSYLVENGTEPVDSNYIEKAKWKLYIIDDTYELSEVFAKVLEIKPDVVVLDYIGLISIRRTDEEAKYTEYSKKVQEFVKRTRVGWVDLSNLPKSQEDLESIRTFGGFYGSSFLKNNADVGIHLCYHTPFYEFKNAVMRTPEFDKIKNKSALEVIITKNRIGTAKVSSVFKVDFDKGGTFTEALPDELNKWKTSF